MSPKANVTVTAPNAGAMFDPALIKRFRIDGNYRPPSPKMRARWRWFCSLNCQTGSLSYFDKPSGELRFRAGNRNGKNANFLVGMVNPPVGKAYHHVGQRNKVSETKADFDRIASFAIRAMQNDKILAVNFSANQFYGLVGPNCFSLHIEPLSGGGYALPSATDAGGASSPARKGPPVKGGAT